MYVPHVSASDCPIPGAELRRLTPANAGQVTVLQRCCWVEEALTNEAWWIPALRETVDEACTRLELFTGAKSERNIRMYERRGYRLIGEWRPGVVLLKKPIAR